MRDVYAAHFSLTATNAFQQAQESIAAWCLDRYPGVGRGDVSAAFEVAPNATDRIEWSMTESGDRSERAWSLMFRHVDGEDPTLGWRVLAQLADPGGGVRFTLRLSQESLEARVRPALEVPGRPRIVRDLARDLGGVLDGRRLSSGVEEIRSG